MRITLAAILGCAATLVSTPIAAEEAPPRPKWDMVAFEVKSWGSPVTSWRLLNNGGGSWTETLREDEEDPGSATMQAWHEIAPNQDTYLALEKILRRLPDPAPDPNDCENFMTDMAYGTLRTTRGATTMEISWNAGCLDADYVAFMDILKEADQFVQSIGRAAPVSRTEPLSRQ